MEATGIFITGASEAAGRELTRRLAADGHQVTGATEGSNGAAIVRQDGGIPAYPDLLRSGEIRSNLVAAQASLIVHAATQIPNQIPMHDGKWERYVALLTEGTLALLEAAQAADVKFIVYLSYAALYGDVHGASVDESAPLSPVSDVLYAAVEAEQQVLNFGIPACVMRVGYVYGATCSALLALRDALLMGRNIPPGSGYANWIHSADLASAVALALDKQPAGQILNIVDGHPAKPSDFSAYLASGHGLPPPTIPPPLLLRLGATQAALLKASVKASNVKARELLGWTPQYATYQAGIEQIMLAWRIEAAVGA